MRAPRWLTPGSVHFVTNRCEQEQFLLLPTEKMNQIISCWLGRALEMFGEGIDIYAFIFLSNHFHLLLKDKLGMLPTFMWYFQTNVAKAINKELGRKGRVFARRYDAALVVDDVDLLDRFQYTLGNAVKAGLVENCGDWKGLSSFGATMNDERLSFKQLDATAYHHARRVKGKKKAKRQDFVKTYDIPIITPDCIAYTDRKDTKKAIGELLQSFEDKHRHIRKSEHKSVLGMQKALQAKYTDRPLNPSFSPRIPVFCRDKDTRRQIMESRRFFIGAYKETFDGFRKAAYLQKRPTVEWPDYSCPPCCMKPVGYELEAA